MKKTFKILLLAIVFSSFIGSTNVEPNNTKIHNSITQKLTVKTIDWAIENHTHEDVDASATSNGGLQTLIQAGTQVLGGNNASGAGDYYDSYGVDIEVTMPNYVSGTFRVDVYDDNGFISSFYITSSNIYTHFISTNAVGAVKIIIL